LLAAIINQSEVKSLESVLLIDNNCEIALEGMECVQRFLNEIPVSKCIVEKKPGLTAARCRAINETASDVLVFFDDDNEPFVDYLTVLRKYFRQYPEVGVWGPGNINVVFLDPVSSDVSRRADVFQASNRRFGFACIPGYVGEATPCGTGFAIRRPIVSHYFELVSNGSLSVTDRQGKMLTSGGDMQIIWEASKLGFASGVIAELRCNHLINASKANHEYIARLAFGCASSYATALHQSLPQIAEEVVFPPRIVDVLREQLSLIVKSRIRPSKKLDYLIRQADTLGRAYGAALVTCPEIEARLRWMAKNRGFV
jgi:hypothetical protein